jgi:hypothetical protein
MFCKRLMVLVCLIATALLAGSANADLVGTYVDATASNTAPGSALLGPNVDTDNLWWTAPLPGVRNDTVLISQGGVYEDAPTLTTTVSGLANGVYDVYAVYWANPGGDWGVQAAISGSSLVTYDGSNGTPTGNMRDNLQERQASLGQVNVIAGSFSVNIDDRAGLSGSDYRSWYDGVSYQAVASPEPSTMALIVTGLVSLLAYAWRKRK